MSNNKYKELLSNTFIFALGSFGSKLISFFLVPLYTNVLTTEQYGITDLIITCANFVVPVISIVIQDAVLRFILSGKYNQGIVCKNAFFVLTVGSLAALGLIPLCNYYAPLSEWHWYIYVIIVTNSISNVVYAYARSIDKNKVYAVAGLINTLFLAGLNIVLLLVFNLGVEGYLLSNILAHIVSIVFLLIATGAIRDMRNAKIDIPLLKQMMAFSAPLIVNNISWWFLNSSNRILIQEYCSIEELGLFTAASKIPNLLSVITSIFSAAWTASSIKEYERDSDKTFFSNIFKMYSLILFFGSSVVMLVLKWFMKIYVGEAFFASWKYVPFLLIGTVFFSFSTFYESIYQALKKSGQGAISTLIASGVNLLITLLLIKYVGVLAASISVFLSYLLLTLIRMYDSRKFFDFKVQYGTFTLNASILCVQAVLITLNVNSVVVSVCALCLLTVINIRDMQLCYQIIKSRISSKLHRNTPPEG